MNSSIKSMGGGTLALEDIQFAGLSAIVGVRILHGHEPDRRPRSCHGIPPQAKLEITVSPGMMVLGVPGKSCDARVVWGLPFFPVQCKHRLCNGDVRCGRRL